jgi:enoyl-CoA hydratase/carnithine racemase
MLLLGESLSAAEALEAGLVARVFPVGTFLSESRTRADRLAALPPESVRETRALLRGDPTPVVERMRVEGKVFAERLRSSEARQAMKAFFEEK